MTHAFAPAGAQDQWHRKCTCKGDCDLNIDPGAPAGKPETAQMVVVHKALRRELSLLPGVVSAVAAGDRRRSARIERHARLVLTFLREYHDSEDRLLWPVLRSRAALSDLLIDTVEEQHRPSPICRLTASLSSRPGLTQGIPASGTGSSKGCPSWSVPC